MPAFALALAGSAAARIASLNLCTDEYVLLLARPEQVVSVSYLSQDPQESALWRQARRYEENRGSIEDVLSRRPTLVLTMGGVGGRATALLASRLHIQMLEIPYATDLDGVVKNLRTAAAAMGNPAAAEPWIARLTMLEATSPARASDAIWISGYGETLIPGSLGTQWLRLAGLRQRALSGGRATLETLLIAPPQVLVRSNYRAGQMSGGARWLEHPVVQHSGAKQVTTDGRPWTCLGPLMIPEIERLRRLGR